MRTDWNIVQYKCRLSNSDDWEIESKTFDNYYDLWATEFGGVCAFATWLKSELKDGYYTEVEGDNEIVIYDRDDKPMLYYYDFEFYHDYEKCYDGEGYEGVIYE